VLFTLALFAIFTHFYLPFRFGVNRPVVIALIYFIPSAILSIFLYSVVSRGDFNYYDDFRDLPLEDRISNALRWVLVSAIISGISTILFPPLFAYLILTPMIAGIGAAILLLFYEILLAYVVRYFGMKFYKKNPLSIIIDLFLKILGDFEYRHSQGLFYQLDTAQLLGDTGEVMQKVLPRYFSRIQSNVYVSEITDPYINRLIERRVAEMAMTLKIYAKMILFRDDTKIKYVEKKLTNNFIAILEADWENYETEKSEEITLLVDLPPHSKTFSKTFDKLRFVAISLLPAGALLLLQNTMFALPNSIVDNLLPFVITWALVSILNLMGSDDIVDRALKVKSIMGSLK
jgi:ABC-type enterochelin transport system permease subunit